MNILIEKLRVKNFRSLKNVEISLKPITLLVGANNAGKTTFLRALNSVLGITRNQINKDDLFVNKNGDSSNSEISIDIKIVPVDEKGNRVDYFDSKWNRIFQQNDILTENNTQEAFAFRTIYTFGIEDTPTISYWLFSNWDNNQLQTDDYKKISTLRNNLKLYFIDAQRDILEDSRQRTSFFGKLVSQLDYGNNLDDIRQQIAELNKNAIEQSPVLSHLKTELAKLNKTTSTTSEGVSISPFSKNIRDLHKGMKVYFQDNGSDSFSMEYHGMGTRSWASIITAGAFTSWEVKQIESKIDSGVGTELSFPIFALEEPEAHLHPNAQRTLYKQLKSFKGQKIISTHSPYVAGQAELDEIRHFYKEDDESVVSAILFDLDDRKKIKELEDKLELEGKTPENFKKYNPEIEQFKAQANKKLNEEDKRKIFKEILLNKGELFFSRCLLLFEGPTEEMALPIFYQKHFGDNHFEDGVTMVSVGGKQNYSPFLKFARFLKIPVFILSDGDDNTQKEVENQIKDVWGNKDAIDLKVLDNLDFEQYLVQHDFSDEILAAINFVFENEDYLKKVYILDLNGQKGKKNVIRNYDGDAGFKKALADCMSENKTDLAQEIAEQIVKSNKAIPPKIKELFDKIAEKLNLNPAQNV